MVFMKKGRLQPGKEDRLMDERRRETEFEDDEIVIDLGALIRGMWKGFRKLWWLVLLLILLGAGGFYAFQRVFIRPMYQCSATFTVEIADGGSGSYSFYYDASAADQLSLTFPYILESRFFQNSLMEYMKSRSLGGTITAETISESNMATMTAKSASAENARALLDAALAIYPDTAKFVLGDIRFNLIDEPKTPQAPYNRMGTKRCLAFGGCTGLAVSLAILGMYALLRRTARDPEEMKKVTSLRCLASVPQVHMKARRKMSNAQKLSVLDERLPYAFRESIRTLQYRVAREMARKESKILLVTSTVPGEGKSTLAAGLAEMLAAKGERVLFIDGDLRKQADAAMLGLRKGYGLEDVLRGRKTIWEALRRVKKSRIFFLGGFRPVKQPAALLSGRNLPEALRELRDKMDYIIIDAPPCGMFQDAGIFAEYAEEILYVVKYDMIPQKEVQMGFTSLQGRDAAFLGYVFNGCPESSAEYGYGRYRYGGYGGYGYGKST